MNDNYYKTLLSKAFSDNYVYMRRTAYKFFHNYQSSEDAIQDTFLKLWIKRNSLPEINNMKSYVGGAIAHTCIDTIRKEKRKRMGFIDDLDEFDFIYDDDNMRKLEIDELRTCINHAIKKLTS